MSEKMKRQPNFAADERIKFIRCLKKHPIILSKKTNGSTNAAKEEAWGKLAMEFNSTNNVPRNKESLKKLWERMKSEAKLKHASYKQQLYKTGGGSPVVPMDVISTSVLEILGKSGIGIDNIYDSDMTDDTIFDRSGESSVQIVEVITDMEQIENSETINSLSVQSQVTQEQMESSQINDDIYLQSQATQSITVTAGDNPNEEASIIQTLHSKQSQETLQNKTWTRRRRPILPPEEQSAAAKLCKKYADCTVEKLLVEQARKALLNVETEHAKELHAAKLTVENEKRCNLISEREQKKALFEIDLEIKKKILQKIENGEEIPSSYFKLINQ